MPAANNLNLQHVLSPISCTFIKEIAGQRMQQGCQNTNSEFSDVVNSIPVPPMYTIYLYKVFLI